MSNLYWERYKKCMDYINGKNLISKSDKAWRFYLGDQWNGIESGNEDLPLLNFIKPVIKHKVSTVSQNTMTAKYSDLQGRSELDPIYAVLNQKFTSCWEKSNMDTILWDTTKQAAVDGDAYQFYGTENVEDVQTLSKTCVLLADEQNQNIQEQPFIIIRERLFVKDIKEVAVNNGVPTTELDAIRPDSDGKSFVGNKKEVEQNDEEGKCTSIIYMEKKEGIVHVARAVEACVYEELRPISPMLDGQYMDKGMTLYPIVNLIWEDKPNDARGNSEVEGLIPNQIEVNKTLARRSMCIKLSAFPRLVYDGSSIKNPDSLDKVGAKIEVNGGGMQSVNQLVSMISPMSMSPDAKALSDDLLSLSQELSGAGETALGNIDPNRVAASAIIAIRDQAALPLNEQVAKVKKFVEDLARLWIEIWVTFNPNGFQVVMQDDSGIEAIHEITKEELEKMDPDIRIDTSKDTPWTRESEQQFLDLILEKQYITFEDYIELAPDNSVVPKNALKTLLAKKKAEMLQQMQTQPVQAMAQQGGVNSEMQGM